MPDLTERLRNLDDNKLIDVVKNYRQYGYDDHMRAAAIAILNSRGITEEELCRTGNYENKTYNYALKYFNSFNRNSKIAFALYIVNLLTNVLIPIFSQSSEHLATFIFIINLLSLVAYFIFFILSFLNQNRFFKIINQDYGKEGALIYLFLGMPFYIFMYFYFKNQIAEKMREIK